MSERMVGCENAEGTLNIHPESEFCEVCESESEGFSNNLQRRELKKGQAERVSK